MDTKRKTTKSDPEISAISIVHNALRSLDAGAQVRVIHYVAGKLGIGGDLELLTTEHPKDTSSSEAQTLREHEQALASGEGPADPLDGISSVARKWMARSGLNVAHLGEVFSLSGNEIDLISESVSGKSKKKKMLNVILLKGVAAYLGSGVSRVSHQQIKETCLHYDAFDGPNFATNLKHFSADISGSKESGYTLTPRGLAKATNLVKQMVQGAE